MGITTLNISKEQMVELDLDGDDPIYDIDSLSCGEELDRTLDDEFGDEDFRI